MLNGVVVVAVEVPESCIVMLGNKVTAGKTLKDKRKTHELERTLKRLRLTYILRASDLSDNED